MNLTPFKTLLLSLLLTTTSLTYAQDDMDCTLPAPENIMVYFIPPDATIVSWSPVAGANGYDVLLIDLNNNLILYSNTVFGTSVTINGIIPPAGTIVAVAALCDNGTAGDYGVESVVVIHVEDLIVQREDGGPSVTYSCDPDNAQVLDVNWGNNNAPGTVTIPITNNSPGNYRQQVKTFVQIETPNAPHLVSLVELQNSPSGSFTQAMFPHKISSQGISSTSNTLKPSPQGTNSYKVNYTTNDPSNPIANFYELDAGQPTQVGFTFAPNFNNNVTVSTMNCFEGKKQGNTNDDDGGSAGLQSDSQQGQDQAVNQRNHPQHQGYEMPNLPGALTLSPNPVVDRLTIKFQQAGQLTIFDSNGRTWHQEKARDNTLQISVADWPAGIYILRQDTPDGLFIQRFVKL